MAEYPLIEELDGLFREDPDIDELGVIFSVAPPTPAPATEPKRADGVAPPSSPPAPAATHYAGTTTEPQFILQQHKLGVSVHSIHPLMNQARAAFPAARRDYRRSRQAYYTHAQQQRHQQQQQQQAEEEDREGGHRRRGQDDGGDEGEATDDTGRRGAGAEVVAAAAERVLSATRALLLVNADHGSAWNARKELVVDGFCEGASIQREIQLLNLIFTKHAKSPNAWAHRRWCWRNSGSNDNNGGIDVGGNDSTSTDGLAADSNTKRLRRGSPTLNVGEELRVCQRVAELYPKNYYAWTQRSWVVLKVVGRALEDTGAKIGAENAGTEVVAGDGDACVLSAANELLQSEVAFVDKWLTRHVSDHSALNHRKNVFSALVAVLSGSDATRLDTIEKERSVISKLLRNYPGHESLWCYRRFLCQAFLVIAPRAALLDSTAVNVGTVTAENASTLPFCTNDDAAVATLPQDASIQDNPDILGRKGGGRAGGGDGSMNILSPTSRGAGAGEGSDCPASATTAAMSACDRGRYDWVGWSRAVAEWHDGCVLEDTNAAAMHDSSSGEKEGEKEEEEGGDAGEGEVGVLRRAGGERGNAGGGGGGSEVDFDEAEGALPAAPDGGGLLAAFLGHEARFALKCATDKGAWQFEQQRRHALAHLAFVSYAADRILGGHSHRHFHQQQRQQQRKQTAACQNARANSSRRKVFVCGEAADDTARTEVCATAAAAAAAATTVPVDLQHNGGVVESAAAGEAAAAAGGGLADYCEVTGAPRLSFPLDPSDAGGESNGSDHGEPCYGCGHDCFVTGNCGGGNGDVVVEGWERDNRSTCGAAGYGEEEGSACAGDVKPARMALRALNEFVSRLDTASNVQPHGSSGFGGSVTPYNMGLQLQPY